MKRNGDAYEVFNGKSKKYRKDSIINVCCHSNIVIFAGNFETITLSHQATDRSVFANGAVRAAEFISTKQNGLYDMTDVING